MNNIEQKSRLDAGSFPEMVKEVRARLLISQVKMASEIGVTATTINRWELGRCTPSFLRKQQFMNYCEKHGIIFTQPK